MSKQPNEFMDRVLRNILSDYGDVIKTSGTKTAEEAQNDIDSEFANKEPSGNVSEDQIFAPEEKMYKEEGSTEGGHYVSDGQLESPETPTGEQPSFDNFMTQEEGGAETKKTVEDPGYREGASPTSDLNISGSTVDKGAAFMKLAEEFVPVHKAFLDKIAAMVGEVKQANPMMDPAAMGDPAMAGGDPAADPAMMDPMGAMAGMAGPGQGGEEGLVEEGGPGELSPEDAAIVDALIETQTGESPLTDEELGQIEAILAGAEAREGGDPAMDPAMAMDPAAMGGDPAMGMDPAMMGGGEPKMAFEMPTSQEVGSSAPPTVSDTSSNLGDPGGAPKVASTYEPPFTAAEMVAVESVLKAAELGEDNIWTAENVKVEDPLQDASGVCDTAEELGDGNNDLEEKLSSLSMEELAAICDAMDAEEGGLGGGDLGGGDLGGGGLDIGGGDDMVHHDELDLVSIIDSMSDEEAAALIAAIAQAEDAGVDFESLCMDNAVEPELSGGELDGIGAVLDEDESKEAAYYGVSVDELRMAKDKEYMKHRIREKQARLQAKNAGQAAKAKRFGQTIDSLIRK